MTLFLDPTGKSSYGLGVCARCSRKFFLEELMDDPNAPGLLVCAKDLDRIDPYRLPPLVPDNIALLYARPDEPLDGTASTTPSGFEWHGVRLPWVVGGWL